MTSHPLPPRSCAQSVLFALAFALVVVPIARAADPAAAANADLARYADRLFSQAYAAGEPGAAVVIAKDGQVLLRKGYGLANLELGVPMRPDMVFEIASITKQFTAAAILLLQERGKLSLEDDVTKYLPDYPTHGRGITLQHLLTHESGIPDYTGLPEWWPQVRQDLTVQQLIALFKDKPLEFSPGEKQAYSNSGYALLGAVIEKASGKSYEDFLEQEIFAPLGMKRSRYGRQSEAVPGRVTGYDRGEDGVYTVGEYTSLTQGYAAGAILSTADDLALWSDALVSGKLLKKTSLARMTTPAKLASGEATAYGYGIGVLDEDGTRILEHGGGTPGFTSDLLILPDRRLVVAVLTNSFYKEPGPDALAYRVTMKVLGKPVEERKAVELDPLTLDAYVGVYRFGETLTRAIFREGNKLVLQRTGGGKHEILPASADDFFFPDMDGRIHFRRDAQGKIAGVELRRLFGPGEVGMRTEG
jgi:D-alanyl-D-alanine carboxypeptidase